MAQYSSTTDSSHQLMARPGGSSIAQVPTRLTVNSTTVEPLFYFTGNYFNGGSWQSQVGGVTLPLVGSGSAPTKESDPLDGWVAVDGVDYNDGQYHESDNSIFDLGTGDLVFELVFKSPASGSDFPGIIGGGDISSTTGWEFIALPGSNAVRLYLKSASGTLVTYVVTSITADTYYHIIAFVNRDEASSNGSRIFRNGTLASSVNPTASPGALECGGSFLVGNGRSAEYREPIVAFGVWEQANWFASGTGSHAEWGFLADDRAGLFGL